MSVIVRIKRLFQMSKPEELGPLLKELNSRARNQSGYIATWTLKSLDNADDYTVISRWETAEDWKQWFKSKERRKIQGKVDSLIGERTFYEIYEILDE